MKVVCDNCGALYKIPDDKLVKPVNKATCRQCGHRMLIPRPRRGADPDERTLVTAVPPTPAPPPMRDDSGPPTTPLHADSEEKTLPTGAPPAEETRWIRNELKTRPSARPPDDRGADRPDRNAMTERVPAHGGPSGSSGQSNDRSQSTDVSLLDDIDPHAENDRTPRDSARPRRAPEPERTPDREPRAGRPPKSDSSRKAKSSAADDRPAHDPRRDMGLALFGVVVAGVGVLILGIDAVIDAGPGAYWMVLSTAVLGTTLACGGLVGAFLVLLTSGRGRKPAWRVASVILAILVGVVAGAVPASVRLGVDSAASISQQVNEYMARTGPPIEEPSLADLPSDGAPDPDITAPDDADDTAAAPQDPTEDATADASTDDASADARTDDAASSRTRSTSGTATSTPRTRTTDRSTTSSPRRRVTISESEPARDAARTPPEEELRLPDDINDLDTPPRQASNPDLPAKPAMQAIDIMVKTNVNVKRCFYEYQKAEGKLPSRLDVPFAIKPSGDATDISVKQSRYAGGELEACLIKAIRGITFPPSQQGTSLTFPFVL